MIVIPSISVALLRPPTKIRITRWCVRASLCPYFLFSFFDLFPFAPTLPPGHRAGAALLFYFFFFSIRSIFSSRVVK